MENKSQKKGFKERFFVASDPFREYLPLLQKGGAARPFFRAFFRRNLSFFRIAKKGLFSIFVTIVLSLGIFFVSLQKNIQKNNGFGSPIASPLGAETSLRGSPLPENPLSLWQDIRGHYGGLSSQEGLAHWLWQRRDEFHGLSTNQLARLQRSEERLRNYLDSSQLRSVFSNMAFELQFQGTPVLTYERGMTRQSPHPLASVTKTFTAVAILKLVAAHKLALDDGIAMYFPEVASLNRPLGGVPIRVRDLLQHSSGISYQPAVAASIQSPYRKLSYPIARQFQPAGNNFHYSNYNYYILAALIERVSKQAYDKFLQEQIFLPLHLQKTSLSAVSTGAAGLRSSSEDLSVFLNALFGATKGSFALLPQSLVLEMIRKPDYLQSHPELCYYGLGIRGQYHKGRLSSVYHTGLWKHTLSEIRYYLSQKVALVHLSSPIHFRSLGVGSYRYRSVALTEKYVKQLHQIFAPHRSSQNPRLVLKNQ